MPITRRNWINWRLTSIRCFLSCRVVTSEEELLQTRRVQMPRLRRKDETEQQHAFHSNKSTSDLDQERLHAITAPQMGGPESAGTRRRVVE
eukprot:g27932.t1